VKSKLYTASMIVSLLLFPLYGYASVEAISTVKLYGLKYVTKYEILNNAVMSKDGRLFVDMKKLNNSLQNNPMIESYTVDINNNILTVKVKEKDILAIVLIEKGNDTIPIEVDSHLKIISTYRVHAYDRPIIKITQDEVYHNKLSPRIIKILMIMNKLKNDQGQAIGRISIIDCISPFVSYVSIHGLQTRYIWDETYEGISLMYSVPGLLDSKSHCPGNGVVTQKRIVVW